MGDDPLLLILIAALLLITGLFSAAEIGFLALGRQRAKRVSQGRLGRLAESLMARPAFTLGAILVAITALNYSNEALAASWVVTHGLPVWIAIVVMATLVVVLAEAAPARY